MLERQGYFPVTSPRHEKDHVRCLKQKKLPSRRFRTLLYCLFQILNPKFLVFHLPEAGQVPRWNASRCRNVYSSVNLSGFSGWHADSHPSSGFQRFTQPRCVVASVCQKRAVIGEEMLEDGCTLVVADLSFSQQKQDRTPMPVTNNMEFGIQANFCSFYKTWRIPFLSRLAAVRRTLRWVESSIREPSKVV